MPTAPHFPADLHTLGNGLRVVLSRDHVAPVVAVNLWYNVGSRHERPGRTGLAHLFEHLMFEGSRQVAPGEHFEVVTSAGGTVNATTSSERTNYFETVPAEQLDAALWLEADRMASLLDALTAESLEKQRNVVRNERRQRYDNVPYGKWLEEICATLFPSDHPYHHQPIGSMEDLAAASLDDVRAFFTTYYAPNRAVLTVVGDIETAATLERIEHYFGAIPAAPTPDITSPNDLAVPLVDEVRQVFVERVPDGAVYLGYRLPPEGDIRLDHLEVAVAALAVGRGGAFERNLVQGEIAKQAAGLLDRRVAGASVGVLFAVARENVATDKLEAALRNEVARLAEQGPTPEELGRAKAVLERRWLDRLSDVEGRADEFSRCTTLFGDPGRVNNWLAPQLDATAAEVRDAARQFLAEAAPVVVVYEPGCAEEEAA